MFRNYLLITWRSLRQHRKSSFLNILGLALGMTAGLLIFQYAWYEWSYDRAIPQSSQIYRLGLETKSDIGTKTRLASTYFGFKEVVDEQIPEVIQSGRIHKVFGGDISVFSEHISKREEQVFYGDPEVLDLFGLTWIRGSEYNLLTSPDKAVITNSGVEIYFPNENPIGKQIEVVSEFDRKTFEIEAVVEDIAQPSHLGIHIILPVADLENDKFIGESIQAKWSDPDAFVYLKLDEHTEVNDVFETKVNQLAQTIIPKWEDKKAFLQPLNDIHLHSNLEREFSTNGDFYQWRFLILLGVFILLIAWFNYINLSTARSLHRSREVGIRKVIGASRNQLISQFMMEAFLLNIIALLVAFTLLQFALPYFANWLEKPLPGFTLGWTSLMLGIVLFGSFLSGVYPAFVLSNFSPSHAINGTLPFVGKKIAGQNQFRRFLVTFNLWFPFV